MSTYRARKEQQKEQQRLEERGYARGPSVPVKEVLKRLQPASEATFDRILRYLDNFYKHERRLAPVINKFHPLPPLEDIAKWVKFVVCTRQGRSTDIIQGETMLQVWHDLRNALYRKAFQCYTNAEIKKITTVSASTQSNRSILIKW